MSDANQAPSLHGQQAVRKADFYAMYSGPVAAQPAPGDHVWINLARDLMTDERDTPKDLPDPEENLLVPAGYTYFGQFVDHDLTFDTKSALGGPRGDFDSQRTPRFDLDCVYGLGPEAAPYMYEDSLRLVDATNDLPRAANGRAIIGDPRNDENSIVCQIQMAFIRFHNAAVGVLQRRSPGSPSSKTFEQAQQEVRWTYQRILVDDYLSRIVRGADIVAFDTLRGADAQGRTTKPAEFKLFPDNVAARAKIPLEFAAAAYRFGHSMVRNGYRMNANTQKHVFSPSGPDSLVGFGELPVSHLIDWALFFPNPDLKATPGGEDGFKVVNPGQHDPNNDQRGKERLQFAYKIDPMLVDPLANLPAAIAGAGGPFSLAQRNLVRGRGFELPSGQEMADFAGLPKVTKDRLLARVKHDDGTQSLVSVSTVHPSFADHTPLWLYILIEAHQPLVEWYFSAARGAKKGNPFTEEELLAASGATTTQLTGLGARIVLETFHGLLDSDATSVRNAAPADWEKTSVIADFRMWDLVNCNLRGAH